MAEKDLNWWHYPISGSNGFIITILLLALVALGERLLYDASRLLLDHYDYFNDLRTISLHAAIIIPILIISIIINVVTGEKRQQYAIALIPYFAASLALSVQLIVEISAYFAWHHTKAEYYVVMVLLTALLSVAIYVIQGYHLAKRR